MRTAAAAAGRGPVAGRRPAARPRPPGAGDDRRADGAWRAAGAASRCAVAPCRCRRCRRSRWWLRRRGDRRVAVGRRQGARDVAVPAAGGGVTTRSCGRGERGARSAGAGATLVLAGCGWSTAAVARDARRSARAPHRAARGRRRSPAAGRRCSSISTSTATAGFCATRRPTARRTCACVTSAADGRVPATASVEIDDIVRPTSGRFASSCAAARRSPAARRTPSGASAPAGTGRHGCGRRGGHARGTVAGLHERRHRVRRDRRDLRNPGAQPLAAVVREQPRSSRPGDGHRSRRWRTPERLHPVVDGDASLRLRCRRRTLARVGAGVGARLGGARRRRPLAGQLPPRAVAWPQWLRFAAAQLPPARTRSSCASGAGRSGAAGAAQRTRRAARRDRADAPRTSASSVTRVARRTTGGCPRAVADWVEAADR